MVSAGAEHVPEGVRVCVCVPSAEPVKPGCETVPVAVVSGDTPVEVFPVTSFGDAPVEAAATALPVKVGCETVPAGVPLKIGAATEPVNVAGVPVKAGAEIVPAGVYVPPPVAPGSAPAAVPFTNLLLRSGVPLAPSHRCQPLGIFASRPDHIAIKPLGIVASVPAGP